MSEKQYSYAVGRRKTATAQVRLFKGKGANTANGLPLETYIKRADLFSQIYAPLKTAGLYDAFHFEVKVEGSGESAQAGAIRHAIARALVVVDENLKSALKGAGFLTRDARQVERKKPGLRKARKSPSWSKR
ncbi:30S ribosomal protein S9 [Candidatus Gracilibacteria bacterium]|nr:30S ribosomal protein S9 [Candidatus Gracilibacteria bacterium]